MVLSKLRLGLLLWVGVVVLTAGCSSPESEAQLIPPSPTPVPQPTPARSAAPEPVRVISVCLGEEPDSLFLYQGNSTAAQIIRQAIYDGPVDSVNYRSRPVILDRLPSLENGDVFFQTVQVLPGEPIVNAAGQLTRLVKGTRYRPAGCREADCEVSYQGSTRAEVDQLVIDFRLLPDVLWSDGEPLTVSDSVFSYQLARELFGEGAPERFSVTESYRSLSATRVRWRGVPGFQSPAHYGIHFFSPLPEHRWGDLARVQLLSSEQTNRRPLGWGPYLVKEWKPGSHLSLRVNPYYQGWSGIQPAYDQLVFRFVEGVPEALQALAVGECELAAELEGWPTFHAALTGLEEEGKLRLVYREGGAWEQITFGIRPLDQRPAFFEQPAVRQAAALCINRPGLVGLEPRAGSVPGSYVPAGHPDALREAGLYPFNPSAGNKLLEKAGWVDEDQDPATPRTARGVAGIPNGTPFEVTFLVFEGEETSPAVTLIAGNLQDCGIKAAVEGLPPEKLLAPGPDGPIFGRRFDLARFAWSRGNFQLCSLYLSQEIPGPYPDHPRGWGGANAAGYLNPEYDRACWMSLTHLPDSQQAVKGFQEAQAVFGEELPALPLYFRRDLVLTAPEFTVLQSGSFIPLWNLEIWD